MERRRLIIQMTIAGMTQYLTKVQGMPQEIEKRLIKTIRCFTWNSTAPPPISLKILTQPIDKGGKKLLDLPARNKAIQLTWLKSYLSLGNNRPAWALLADEILRTNIINAHSNLDQTARINTFLQNWRPNINKIPQDLKEMLKVAKEFK